MAKHTHKYLIDRLKKYYTDSEILEWLVSPQPILNDESPLAIISLDGSLGIDQLHAVLDQLDSGIYL